MGPKELCNLGISQDPDIKERVPITDQAERARGFAGTSESFALFTERVPITDHESSAILQPI